MPATGSRRQVKNGTAQHTSGGLSSADITKNKAGKLVSRKASQRAKKAFAENPLMQAWRKLVQKHFVKGSGAEGLKNAMKKAKAEWPAVKRSLSR
jgi:hypothetical protein